LKLAIISGASKGIGQYLSIKLLEEKFKVVNISRSKSKNENVIDYEFDLLKTNKISDLVKDITRTHGSPQLLINNAGIASMNHTLLMKDNKIADIVNLNLTAPLILSKEISKTMIREGGKILNISSVAVPLLLQGEAVYASSKSGLEIFTKILSKELAEVKIEVACLGLTPIFTDLIKNVPKEKIDNIINQQPIKKTYTEIDIWEFLNNYINDKKQKFNGTVNYLGGFVDK
jgi:3-oxoacyl-[acyl-carrier protein] reductase